MSQLVLKNILAGSGNVLAGGDNSGNVNKVTIGSNLTLSGGVLSATGGGSGSVTSVAVSRSGDALSISGSPITSAGTINIGFAGTGAQYIKGDGTLATFPTTISQAQKLITEVYNETGATLTKGTVVYINGGHGNLPTVTKAIATGDATSAQTYGVVQSDITNNNNGFVVVIGSLTDMDTQTYTAGTQLYLSPTTAGAYTSVKQYAPAHLVYVGIVVRSHPTQGVIEIRIQNGFELDELHNVSAQTPTNGDILQYNSTTSLWTSVAGTTTNIAEGTNLYFTNARARGVLSTNVGSALSYNSTTGRFTLNAADSGTDGYLTAGDWTDFDSKQASLGTGTTSQYLRGDLTWAAPPAPALEDLTDVTITSPTNGQLLRWQIDHWENWTLPSYVQTTRTLTINGTAYDLSANRTWSVGTITDLTGEATASGTGSVAVTLTNSAVIGKVLTGLNVTGGSVSATDSILTAFGKVQNQINGLIGGSIYKGTWNASTNTPALASSVGTAGWYYIVSVAGSTNLNGITDWQLGDWAIFNGGVWQKVDNTDSVVSVNGFTGAVSLTTDNISEGATNLYYTNTRARGALSANPGSALTYNSSTGRFTLNAADGTVEGYVTAADYNYWDSKQASLGTGTTSQWLRGDLTWSTVPAPALDDLTDVTITTPTNGQLLRYQAGTWINFTPTYIVAGYLSATAPLSYNSGTGVFSISQATTSTNGYLSSTDFNTFNNKQNALTNPVTGTGTINYLPKFTGTSTIGNSAISDNGATLSFGLAATFSSSVTANAASQINGLSQDALQTIFTLQGANASAQTKALYFRLTAGTPLWSINTGAAGLDAAIDIKPDANNGLRIPFGSSASSFTNGLTIGGDLQLLGVNPRIDYPNGSYFRIYEAGIGTRFNIEATSGITTIGDGTSTKKIEFYPLAGSPRISVEGGASSNTQGIGAQIRIFDNTNNRGWNTQMDASYNYSLFYYNGTAWSRAIYITGTGSATYGGTIEADTFTALNYVNAYNRFRLYFNGTSSLASELYEDGTSTNGGTLTLFGKASGTVDTVISAAPTKLNYINNAANVMIGWSTDQGYKLAVNGAGYFSGSITTVSDVIISGNIYTTKLTSATGIEYQVRNANGPSGNHVFKSYNTAILTLDGGTNNSTFGGSVTVGINEALNNSAYNLYVLRGGTAASPGTYNIIPAILIQDYAGDGPATQDLAGGLLRINAGRIGDGDANAANATLMTVNNDTGSALHINGKRQVGINKTSPSYTLDVNGTGGFSGKLTGANASFSANVSGDVVFGITNTNTTNGYGLRVQGGVGSTSYALNVVNAADTTDLFKVMGSGAASFSSTVTSKGLIIQGNYSNITSIPDTGVYGTDSAFADGYGGLILASRIDVARPILFGTYNGTSFGERIRVTSGGNLQIGYSGTPAYAGKLFISRSDQYGMTLDAASGYGRITTTDDFLYLRAGGTDRLTISSSIGYVATSDNFGVRRTPSYALDVNGGTNGINLETNITAANAVTPYFTILETGVSRTVTGYSYGTSQPLAMAITQTAGTTFGLYRASEDTVGSTLRGMKSRGTAAAPASVANGDDVFSVEGWAWHGAGPNLPKLGAGMKFVKDDNWGTANVYAPQRTEFYNANSGTTVITTMIIYPSGNITVTGSVTATGFFESSDKRLKEELIDNPSSVNIENVKPKLYIKNGKEELGYYAQDLENILPSSVTKGEDGYLNLSYTQVHTAKIAALENKIEQLEALIKTLIK